MESESCSRIYQPSLLRGLYRTESVPVNWDEVYRLITEDKTVRQQTELYRSTHDEKYKHALPALTTAVQLDGKGKAMENIVGYTGVTHCDLDHVPEERLGEVLEKIKADPHTFLCNVSPSGWGIHIYGLTPALPQREGDYYEAFMAMNCHYADLLGLPFDEQCSNPNKTLSLSHDPDAYYNPSAERFQTTNAHELNTNDLGLDMQKEKGVENNNLCFIRGNSWLKTHWTKVERDPIEFAEEYVRNRRGLTYTEGCRNAYLYECLNMMNLLGVPRTDAESWLHGFDLPEREKMSVLKSAYKRTGDFGKFEQPYRWEQVQVDNNIRGRRRTNRAISVKLIYWLKLNVNNLKSAIWVKQRKIMENIRKGMTSGWLGTLVGNCRFCFPEFPTNLRTPNGLNSIILSQFGMCK